MMPAILTILLAFLLLPLAVWGQAWPSAMPVLNRSHPLMRDLRAWWVGWPGLAPSATWIDVVNRNDATLSGPNFTTVNGWNALGRRGGAWQVEFDASGALQVTAPHASVYDFDRTNPFTIAAWVKSVATGSVGFLEKYQATSPYQGYQLQLNTTGPYAVLGDTNSLALNAQGTAAAAQDNQWHQLVLRYDGSSTAAGIAWSMDGQPLAVSASGGPLTGSTLNTRAPVFGAAGYFGAGALDDVRIWGRLLSDQEVSLLYTQSLRGDPELLSLPTGVPALPVAGKPGQFMPFFR